ncbi:hypothetical protein C8Q76DRAFT_707148 [Earliella scabrosa]|nr:hypothetical protein C8Q76DRAFT_707148 [Earliella scabrosa]
MRWTNQTFASSELFFVLDGDASSSSSPTVPQFPAADASSSIFRVLGGPAAAYLPLNTSFNQASTSECVLC